ncbi:ABC transporter permease subunit [bacterium]|nr:ABC transporter permease subunit [bacterium]
MSRTLTIFKKEFRQYFDSPIGYIFITVFLVINSWLFFRTFFLMNQASVRPLFFLIPWIFLFFVPAVTMRLWAEEKKAGTIEVLMTFPIKDWQVVLGKYLASLLFLVLALALTFTLPLTAWLLAAEGVVPDLGPVLTSYLGSIFLGGAFLAIGLWVSSLTENQIVAFIIAIAASFVLMIIGDRIVTMYLPSAMVGIAQYLGLNSHFSSIERGVLDTRDIVYYLSVIYFFIYLTIRSVESRKWQ